MFVLDVINELIKNLRSEFGATLPADDSEIDLALEKPNSATDAEQKLLNRSLLIDPSLADELISRHGYVDVATSPYPQNAVKAVWNLAIRAKKILGEGLVARYARFNVYQIYTKDRAFLNTHLSYLDAGANNYLPVVIDQTTLKLAYLFRKFLTQIQKNKELINDFSQYTGLPVIGGYVQTAIAQAPTFLGQLLRKLDSQTDAYEARRPEVYIKKVKQAKEITITKYRNAIVAISELLEKSFTDQELLETMESIGTLDIERDLEQLSVFQTILKDGALEDPILIANLTNLAESLIKHIQELQTLVQPYKDAVSRLQHQLIFSFYNKVSALQENQLPLTLENIAQIKQKTEDLRSALAELRDTFKTLDAEEFEGLENTILAYDQALVVLEKQQAQQKKEAREANLKKIIDELLSKCIVVSQESTTQVYAEITALRTRLLELQDQFTDVNANLFGPLKSLIETYGSQVKSIRLTPAEKLRQAKITSNKALAQLVVRLSETRYEENRLTHEASNISRGIHHITLRITSLKQKAEETHSKKMKVEAELAVRNSMVRELSDSTEFDVLSRSWIGIAVRYLFADPKNDASPLETIVIKLNEISTREAELALLDKEHAALTHAIDLQSQQKSNAESRLFNVNLLRQKNQTATRSLTEEIAKEKQFAKEIDEKQAALTKHAIPVNIIASTPPKAEAVETPKRDKVDVDPAAVRKSIYDAYFGTSNKQENLVQKYLTERAESYFFEDCVRSTGEVLFKCFGYESDATRRYKYFQEVKQALMLFMKTGNSAALMRELDDKQLKKFTSRAKIGTKEYEKSMHSLLTKLRHQIESYNYLWPRTESVLKAASAAA